MILKGRLWINLFFQKFGVKPEGRVQCCASTAPACKWGIQKHKRILMSTLSSMIQLGCYQSQFEYASILTRLNILWGPSRQVKRMIFPNHNFYFPLPYSVLSLNGQKNLDMVISIWVVSGWICRPTTFLLQHWHPRCAKYIYSAGPVTISQKWIVFPDTALIRSL